MDNLSPDTARALLQASQVDGTTSGQKLKDAVKTRDLERIKETAQEFEAVFISEMLKPMFEGLDTHGEFGGGKGEEVFRGMMLQEYGKLFSQTGGIGLADSVKDAMIQMQEAADAQANLSQSLNTDGDEHVE